VLLVMHDTVARGALFASFAAGIALEALATLHGRRGDTFRLRSGGRTTLDRGTGQVVVLAMVAGFFAAVLLARSAAGFRAGANTWATYALGLLILWAGIGLRVWAVWSLGRYFRREVTIEPGQTVHRSGPYRFVRHPAYTGDILIAAGFGLAWGSWVGAAVALVATFAGHLPRILVEEAALREALGDAYESYARGRARLVPGVW
jgi:protein-S-isoprenylcysteine O-methyltransferase Ste14